MKLSFGTWPLERALCFILCLCCFKVSTSSSSSQQLPPYVSEYNSERHARTLRLVFRIREGVQIEKEALHEEDR
jgi:hypothetical protein